MRVEVIEQVIQDLELQQKGATLYYAVDPFDLVTFCFPIAPNEPELRNLDDIADEQAALYEVVFGRKTSPIVLSEYVDEIDSILAYVQRRVERAYYKTSAVEALINRVKSRKADLSQAIADGVKNKDDATDFNIILAVVMGIYSLGIKRFQEVCERLNKPDDPDLQRVLWELDAGYEETETTEWLFERLSSMVSKNSEESARTDARAIDRLFFMNSGLEEAFLKKRMPNRHIFLYLSSAERSSKIFASPELQQRFPTIDRRRLSLHRRPEHVFSMLVNKGVSEEPRVNIGESIEALRAVLNLLRWDRANQLRRKFSPQLQQLCPACIQDGGQEEACALCPNLTNCKAVLDLSERYNQQRVRTIQNLGLMTVVQRYHELRQAQAGNNLEQRFLDFFHRVADDTALEKRALERITEQHRLVKAQLDFKSFLSSSHRVFETPEHADRRVIHLFLPVLQTESVYREVSERLAASESATVFEENLRYYDEAVKAFTSIDSAKESVSELHELVRCILYFDCPTSVGDRLAFDHAREMLDRYPKYKNQFWVVLALVAPRLLRFNDGEWYAREGLHDFSDDPRLHHARALNQIRWLRAQPERENRRMILDLAIAEQRDAIELCKRRDSPYKRLLAIGYNNLAYYHCFDDWSDNFDETNVRLAREALNNLKAAIPKEKWPEEEDFSFFHTEAQVEYYEARCAGRERKFDQALYKLKCAGREISFAIEHRPKDIYRELSRRIQAEVDLISKLKADEGQMLASTS